MSERRFYDEWKRGGASYPMTLSIRHLDRRTERYRLMCDHGNSDRTETTEDGPGQMAVFERLVSDHRHRYRCECRPSEWIERWESQRDAIAQYEADLADFNPIYERWQPKVAEQLEHIRALHCETCEPAVVLFVDLRAGAAGAEEPEMTAASLVHQQECPHVEDPLMMVDGLRQQIGAVTMILETPGR